MVFFINRDALFSRDNLFPITFFAVWVERETVIERQSGIVAIEVYLQFERAVFV
jgi:hypothetical protein